MPFSGKRGFLMLRYPSFARGLAKGAAFIAKLRIVHRIAIDAMLTALYFALSYFSIPIGGIEISLASFPVVLSALVFGPLDSAFVALLGEFLDQVLKYGVTLTTAFWIIPPMLRGLTIGLFAFFFAKRGRRLEENLFAYILVAILGAFLTSGGNTLASYLDSLVYDYPLALVYVMMAIRFAVGMITAIIIALACRPLAKVIRGLESQGLTRL